MADPQHNTFHVFPFLPKEMRLQIWRATWEPRDVHLRRTFWGAQPDDSTLKLLAARNAAHITSGADLKGSEETEQDGERVAKTVTWSTAKPPVTLFVNTESFQETILFYHLAFAMPGGGSSWVLFNFDLDHLRLPSHIHPALLATKADFSRLRSVTLPTTRDDVSADVGWLGITALLEGTSSVDELRHKNQLIQEEAAKKLEATCPALESVELLARKRCMRRLACPICSGSHIVTVLVEMINGEPYEGAFDMDDTFIDGLKAVAQHQIGDINVGYHGWAHRRLSINPDAKDQEALKEHAIEAQRFLAIQACKQAFDFKHSGHKLSNALQF